MAREKVERVMFTCDHCGREIVEDRIKKYCKNPIEEYKLPPGWSTIPNKYTETRTIDLCSACYEKWRTEE